MKATRVLAALLTAWLCLVSAAYAQEDFAEPIGEEDAPVGGATLYGEDVGSAPIDGAVVGGEAVQDGGEGAPVGGAVLGGEPVQEGEGAPVGGDTLY
jgi:hypothetical protein